MNPEARKPESEERKPGDKVSLEALYESARKEWNELLPKYEGTDVYKRHLTYAFYALENEGISIPRETFVLEENTEHSGFKPLPSQINWDAEIGTIVEYEGELWVVLENQKTEYGDTVDWDNLTIAPLKALKKAFQSDLR